jgi:branched-chain amino acid transport system substrate-binding protein
VNPKHLTRFRAGLPPAATVLALLLLGVVLLSCAGPSPTPPATTLPETTAEPPPTLAVTRIVTQEVVVTATPTPRSACAPEESGEVVLGVLGPFSQNSAWPKALAMQAGVGLAIEDLNSTGGVLDKPLRLALEDTAGDPTLAAQAAEKLIVEDCASALIGGFTLEEATAIKEVSLRLGVPFLIVEATADELTSDRPATVFRVAPAASMLAQMPALWLQDVGDFNGDGTLQVVLIVENTPSGDQTLVQASQVLTNAGIAFDTLRVDVPSQDYSPQVARIVAREQAPDAILLYVAGDAALDVQRQLLDAGIGPQKGTLLVSGRSALDPVAFWQKLPDGALTVIGRRGPWNTSLTPMGQTFVERFRQLTTQWPEPVAFAAYDSVHLLADAAKRAGTLSAEDLVAALETADIWLASGYYYFSYNSQRPPSGPLEPEYLWHQWPEPPLLYLQYREPMQDPATLDVIWPPRYRTIQGDVIRP